MHPDTRKPPISPGMVFFAVGLVFFVLGVSGKTAFLGVGIAFFTLGLVFIAKSRKQDTGKDDAP